MITETTCSTTYLNLPAGVKTQGSAGASNTSFDLFTVDTKVILSLAEQYKQDGRIFEYFALLNRIPNEYSQPLIDKELLDLAALFKNTPIHEDPKKFWPHTALKLTSYNDTFIEGVLKSTFMDFCKRAVAVWKISYLLGLDLVPPTFLIQEGYFGTTAQPYIAKGCHNPDGCFADGHESDPLYAELRLFNYLIGNDDCHIENWMYISGNEVHPPLIAAFDHERAFIRGYPGKKYQSYVCPKFQHMIPRKSVIERIIRLEKDLVGEQLGPWISEAIIDEFFGRIDKCKSYFKNLKE